MIHVYGFETHTLEALCPQRAPSPEDFLIYLEEALESGELTIDEVAQLVHDFTRRN